jgi:hypothetical protein
MEDTTGYEDWSVVFTTNTDYEADMVRDRLDTNDIPAVVLTQRDHAFNLTVGDLAEVFVMVPPDFEEDARYLLLQNITEEELDEAARVVAPEEEPPSPDDPETMFDSGNERIRFTPPEKDEDESTDE